MAVVLGGSRWLAGLVQVGVKFPEPDACYGQRRDGVVGGRRSLVMRVFPVSFVCLGFGVVTLLGGPKSCGVGETVSIDSCL